MKNILIITDSKSRGGVAFVKDINDILDQDVRDMVINCLQGNTWQCGGHCGDCEFWARDYECGSDDAGYVFSDYCLTENMLPITVEHVVTYFI